MFTNTFRRTTNDSITQSKRKRKERLNAVIRKKDDGPYIVSEQTIKSFNFIIVNVALAYPGVREAFHLSYNARKTSRTASFFPWTLCSACTYLWMRKRMRICNSSPRFEGRDQWWWRVICCRTTRLFSHSA